MAEISSELVQAVEYLHNRPDLHTVGPFSVLKRSYGENPVQIWVAPGSRIRTIDELHTFEQELVDYLAPPIYSPARNTDGRVKMGEFNITSEEQIKIFPSSEWIDLFLFWNSAKQRLASMGTHYDASWFGVYRGGKSGKSIDDDVIETACNFVMGLQLVQESLLAGNGYSYTVEGALQSYVDANTKMYYYKKAVGIIPAD